MQSMYVLHLLDTGSQIYLCGTMGPISMCVLPTYEDFHLFRRIKLFVAEEGSQDKAVPIQMRLGSFGGLSPQHVGRVCDATWMALTSGAILTIASPLTTLNDAARAHIDFEDGWLHKQTAGVQRCSGFAWLQANVVRFHQERSGSKLKKIFTIKAGTMATYKGAMHNMSRARTKRQRTAIVSPLPSGTARRRPASATGQQGGNGGCIAGHANPVGGSGSGGHASPVGGSGGSGSGGHASPVGGSCGGGSRGHASPVGGSGVGGHGAHASPVGGNGGGGSGGRVGGGGTGTPVKVRVLHPCSNGDEARFRRAEAARDCFARNAGVLDVHDLEQLLRRKKNIFLQVGSCTCSHRNAWDRNWHCLRLLYVPLPNFKNTCPLPVQSVMYGTLQHL